MLSLSVRDVRLRAPLGVTPEERQTGAHIGLSVDIDYRPHASPPYRLEDLIDYDHLRRILVEEARRPEPLLENLAHRLVERIRRTFPGIERIRVTVTKYRFSGAFPEAHASVSVEMSGGGTLPSA